MTDDTHRIDVTYRVRADAGAIDARAQAIALEQSVELPLDAVDDRRIRDEVVAQVANITALPDGRFDVVVRIAVETTGDEAGQLLNMLFGNASLQDDVELRDAIFPPGCAQRFGGPRFGIAGLRALTAAAGRPLTATALKPQGLSPAALASLAGTFARAGIDVIKDDHGLADQQAAPFAERVAAVQRAVDAANRDTGGHSVYVPALHGDTTRMRTDLDFARGIGVRMVMIAPMLSGVASLAALARDAGVPILAHPSLAGATRIAAPLLLGKLFRLFGADAVIFPNAGGRFGYSPATCMAIAEAARGPFAGLAPAMPVPAGGMQVGRVAEMRTSFGDDTMLLVGGALRVGDDELSSRCRAFVQSVRQPAVRITGAATA